MQNARFLLSENERFGLVFVKTWSINSGTVPDISRTSFHENKRFAKTGFINSGTGFRIFKILLKDVTVIAISHGLGDNILEIFLSKYLNSIL
jgi:hypothetical protein